jgi:AcrR family transcriptional regulator
MALDPLDNGEALGATTAVAASRSVTRAQVMGAAMTLFAAQGYRGTTMKDIASQLGIRAPSLYNHVTSKQELLQEIMFGTMRTLIADHEAAVATTDDVVEQVRRSMEAHVRYHARYRREAHIGNREIASLEQPARDEIREMRRVYSRRWQDVIERGLEENRFTTRDARLAAYALLEMGIGVALWFREDGSLSEEQVAYVYGDMALRLLSARP